MWPFKRTENTKQQSINAALDSLREFRGVGEKFTYLGVEMVVTGHYDLSLGLYGALDIIPSLNADYVNKNGEIKSVSFSPIELNTLIAENT